MLDIAKKYFGSNPQTGPGREERHDIRVATCAIMLEMAAIDGEFGRDEAESVLEILAGRFGLERNVAHEIAVAAQKELDASIDLWQFTNLINSNYTEQEKIGIMELVWQVVYADGKLDRYEDHLARKVASLLRLHHTQMIEAKLRVKYALEAGESGKSGSA